MELMGFIPTVDAQRAREFYVSILKLEFLDDDQFAMVVKSGNNKIRIVRMGKFEPAPFTVLGWEVSDIDVSVQELSASGVTFARYSFLQQDNSGIWTSPSGSKVAWFQDPDGNILSLSQH